MHAWLHALRSLVCVALLLSASAASAQMVWDESGPPDQRGGLHAIAIDPQDAEVVWVIDQSRVWVTDDGGSTWQVVMIITGLRDADDEDSDDSDREDSDDEDFLASDEDDAAEDAESGEEQQEELQTFSDSEGRLSSAEPEEIARLVSVRLRVIGSYVYACTPVGLWRVPRDARTLGSDQEVRLPQRRAVLDVADYGDGALLVGTASGLLELSPTGEATSLFDEFGRRAVTALLVEDGNILAGTTEGLWLDTGFGFEALNVGARGGVPQDIVRISSSMVAVATGRHVIAINIRDQVQIIFVPEDGGTPTKATDEPRPELPVDGAAGADAETGDPDARTAEGRPDEGAPGEAEVEGVPAAADPPAEEAAPGEAPLPPEIDPTRIGGDAADMAGLAREVAAWSLRVRRLAIDRDGDLWAAGSGSVFRWRPGTVRWEQMDRTLDDRRLSDIAAAARGMAHVWVTGRGGAYRWIPERIHLITERARRGLQEIVPGVPPVWEVLALAERARHAERGQEDTIELRKALSVLAPEVRMNVRYGQLRYEDRIFVPELERDLVSWVAVAPDQLRFQVYALWDLMPAMHMMLGPDTDTNRRRDAAAKDRIALRDMVVGRYNSWIKKLVHARAGRPDDVLTAVEEILELQNLEADLHAITAGDFLPITTLESFSKAPPG